MADYRISKGMSPSSGDVDEVTNDGKCVAPEATKSWAVVAPTQVQSELSIGILQ